MEQIHHLADRDLFTHLFKKLNQKVQGRGHKEDKKKFLNFFFFFKVFLEDIMYTLHSYLYCIFLCADSLSCQEPKNEEKKRKGDCMVLNTARVLQTFHHCSFLSLTLRTFHINAKLLKGNSDEHYR